MKKALVLLAALVLIASAAAAEVDLSGMSFEELVDLAHRVDQAIWASDGWQEVTVPPGTYKVGEDIPARKWTVKATEAGSVLVYYCAAIDDAGSANIFGGASTDDWIYSPSARTYDPTCQTEATYDMKEGMYFIVMNGNAVFTPYMGKSSLGFK